MDHPPRSKLGPKADRPVPYVGIEPSEREARPNERSAGGLCPRLVLLCRRTVPAARPRSAPVRRSQGVGRSIKFLISPPITQAVAAPKSSPSLPIRGRGAAALTVIVALAGCGSSGSSSSTTATVAGQTTANHAATPAHHDRVPHAASKASRTAPAKSSKKHSQSVAHVVVVKTVARPVIHAKQPVISAGVVTSTLTGTGKQAIGTLSEKTTVVLQWSTTAGPIQIFGTHGFLLVNSNATTGRVRLARGDYKGLRVAAKGHWTIQVRAS